MHISDEALTYLAKAGYDPVYGARPLKRTLQHALENSLAQDLLSGKFVAGDAISVTLSGDQIVFLKK